MKRIEDFPELSDEFIKAFKQLPQKIDPNRLMEYFEHFFLKGYEVAIAERAKFDEENGLIVKDIGEL